MGAPERVLVVDDEESFHDSVRRYLRPYEVTDAYNGLQMIATLDRRPVDVVLLDLELPAQNGFQLLPKLRARRIPTIVVSAHAGASNVVQALRGGAFDFLEKSLASYRRLDASVQAALAHRRWTNRGRDPACLAELEKLACELAELGPGAVSPPSATAGRCHDELAHAIDQLASRDRRRDQRAWTYHQLADHFRRLVVRIALVRCRGNRQRAADALGVSYRTFLRWCESRRDDP